MAQAPSHPLEAEIAAKLAPGFERAVLSAALLSLKQFRNPLRFNNFATNLRELNRIVLDRLAPDIEITGCKWYKSTSNQNNPTRADRITYAVQAGLLNDFIAKELVLDVEQMRKDLDGCRMLAYRSRTHTSTNFVIGWEV